MTYNYDSPVAMPCFFPVDDYRSYRDNRIFLVSVRVNQNRYYLNQSGKYPELHHSASQADQFGHYFHARDRAIVHLAESTGYGYDLQPSAHLIKFLMKLDILPKVAIDIASVDIPTEMGKDAFSQWLHRLGFAEKFVWHEEDWTNQSVRRL